MGHGGGQSWPPSPEWWPWPRQGGGGAGGGRGRAGRGGHRPARHRRPRAVPPTMFVPRCATPRHVIYDMADIDVTGDTNVNVRQIPRLISMTQVSHICDIDIGVTRDTCAIDVSHGICDIDDAGVMGDPNVTDATADMDGKSTIQDCGSHEVNPGEYPNHVREYRGAFW